MNSKKRNITLKQAIEKIEDDKDLVRLGLSATSLAHELSNPLSYMYNSISIIRNNLEELLESESDLPTNNFSSSRDTENLSDIYKSLESLEEGILRIKNITQNLYDYKQTEKKILKVNIHEIIDETLLLMNSEINGKIEIEKVYGDLPLIDSYEGKLHQVFTNIIKNALEALSVKQKHSNNKKVVSIFTSIEKDDYISISIEDTGVGMDTNMIKNLFKPFTSTKKSSKPRGLGMSITSQIIEQHQGTIKVKSIKNKGTRFTISLPISILKYG